MEKRMFIAAALSLGALFLWEAFFVPKPPARKPPVASPVEATAPASPAATDTAAVATPARPAAPAAPIAGTAEQSVVVENPVLRATFSNRGAVMTSLVLKRYTDDQGRPLEVVRQVPSPAPRPFSLRFPGRQDWSDREPGLLFAVESSGRQVRFQWADGTGSITKEIRLSDGYLFDVHAAVAGPPFELFVGTGLRNPSEKEQSSRYILPAEAVVTAGGSLTQVRSEKLAKPVSWQLDERGFAGIEDNYFLAVLMPRQRTTAEAIPVPDKDAAGKPATVVATAVAGNGALDARAYYGPKDVEILESVGAGLERTVDFGWYSIVARPLLWLLKRVYSWVGNWGASILLVTLLIRLLLFPLMHKSYVSMKKMQKLAPKMNAIRDKYKKAKTDAAQRQKMNEELMKLYQAEGYNPMSGCFPILLQLPILIAFYNVLSKTIELRHAPFALWIKDLSAVDQTYVLLILMIASMYVQQAMTPSTADPTQKKIFMAMPFIWGFFLKDMPSGLVLYWLFSNVLTILQQVIINRMSDKEEPEKPKRLKSARVKEAQG